MIRFILAIIILTLIITYAILPAIKYLKKFFAAESKRIKNTFEKDESK